MNVIPAELHGLAREHALALRQRALTRSLAALRCALSRLFPAPHRPSHPTEGVSICHS